MFYDYYDSIHENAYEFPQFQFAPSIRYTDFEHGDDFTFEYFNRRDLTIPSSGLDRRLLSTRSGKNYDNYDVGNYLDLVIAAMTDLTWDWGLNLVLGVHYDTIDIESTSRSDLLLFATGDETPVYSEETVGGLSYQAEDWSFNVTVNNLTDERYFRANFPDLFGVIYVFPYILQTVNVANYNTFTKLKFFFICCLFFK